jgi:hypothetical protein
LYMTLQGGLSRHTGSGESSVTGFLTTNLSSVSVHRTEECRAHIWCAHAYLLARKVPSRLCSNGVLLLGTELEFVSMRWHEGWNLTHTLKSDFLKTRSSSVPVATPGYPSFTPSSSQSISMPISKWCEVSSDIGWVLSYTAVSNRHERKDQMHKHTTRSLALPSTEDWVIVRSGSSNCPTVSNRRVRKDKIQRQTLDSLAMPTTEGCERVRSENPVSDMLGDVGLCVLRV